MNTKSNQMNQKMLKSVFFTALAIGLAAAVKQQKPQLTAHDVEARDRRCPLEFDNQNAILYPHGTDGTRYYICVENGTLVTLRCPDGMEFDEYFSICFWPNDNGNSSNSAELRTRGLRAAQNGNNNRPPAQKHPKCSSAKDGYLFPNYANNCKSFFKCHAGYAYQILCGQGLLFNELTNYCDWEQNVQCKKPNGGGGGGGGGGNHGQYQTPSCAGLVDGTMFANHQSGCKSFYICVHGQYTESRCEGQLMFNERIRACDWPQNVNCVCHDRCIGNSVPYPPQTTRPPTNAPATLPSNIEHHPSGCNGNNMQVPKCPPQPCPPENCVMQACIPYAQYNQNHNQL